MRSSSKPEKRTYTDLLIILVILAAVLAWFFWPSAHRKPASEDSRPQELALNVMPLAPRDVSLTQSYIGYVTPIHSVDIVPYINGFLEDIMVDGGQRVERGDNLILIRQNEYKASLEAAEASVLQADATLNNAAVYYRRVKQAGTKVISKTELDNAKASYLSAKAALAQAKANRDLAKVNFDYTIIQAPISGIVGNVDLTRGDYVSPSSGTLLKIIQFDPIRVVFSITDKDYLNEMAKQSGGLFNGEAIKIRLSNGQIYNKTGKFRFLDNEINRSTNSIAVYADFENENHTLVANAYVDVLLEKNIKNGVPVRQNLVTMEDSGNYVYVVKDDRLERRKVDILGIRGNDYILKNSFAVGEYLVLDKVGRIIPGQKLKLNVVGGKTGEGQK